MARLCHPAESRRTLVLVAHPDDEAIAFGGLLPRLESAMVVFATDGAPRHPSFWPGFAMREEYAGLRRSEAQRAADVAGIVQVEFLNHVDQELHRSLPDAADGLAQIAERWRPDAVLTLAYEGGHPDHDACAFLAHQLSQDFGLDVWEAPLYHRSNGTTAYGSFLKKSGVEVTCALEEDDLRLKLAMLECYASQSEVWQRFDAGVETYRRPPAYDFIRAPHAGPLNYEAWGWATSGRELCAAFKSMSKIRRREALKQTA